MFDFRFGSLPADGGNNKHCDLRAVIPQENEALLVAHGH
jgi:hypothetical protein